MNSGNKEKYRLLCQTEESIPLFSRDWWLDVVCGERWDVLFAESADGAVLAALPMYIPIKGLVTMPHYTQTMGIWFAPAAQNLKYISLLEQRQMLCKQLIDQIPANKFLQNFNYSFTDWLPFYWKGFKQTTRYTYVLQNIKNKELLWSNMRTQTRGTIKKAAEISKIVIKTGVSVEDFLAIQTKTFDRQGLINKQSAEILGRLIMESRERKQGEIFGAYDEKGLLHSAAFVVWQSSSAYYIAAGGDPDLRNSGGQSLALWEAIRYVSQFTDIFDFEGSMLQGVEFFFRSFGAVQMPYFTISKGKISLFDRLMIKIR